MDLRFIQYYPQPPFYDEDTNKMYAKKMSAELEIPEDIDPDAADLIRKVCMLF